MNLPILTSDSVPSRDRLESLLRSTVKGEVRFDALTRTLYATDASIYEIFPHGVVTPRDQSDVTAVVRACRETGVSIIARGAGTGLSGGAIGFGVIVDMSRHMNTIEPVDVDGRSVVVGPGVVLDELNRHLATMGLRFAPDVATGSRATIGGMIGNNSCGAGSILYGRTVDHIRELTVALSDGELVTFGASCPSHRAEAIASALAAVRDEFHEDIARRFPKVLRSNGGYGLDRLGPHGAPADPIKVLCGSEGTLGLVVSAKLNLLPVVRHKGLLVFHYREMLDALAATPAMLTHRPAAVELVDHLIIDAGRANTSLAPRTDFLRGGPGAILVVELHADSEDELRERLARLENDTTAHGAAYAAVRVLDPSKQQDVWKLRTSGLGLLMSKPGDAQPYAFVEDTAVDPAVLRDYIAEFMGILRHEGVTAGCYAHASVGCIHVKPVLNLKQASDVETMRRIADAVGDLVLRFGGTMSGEHGDGIVRSCWLEKLYGPRLMTAFHRVKHLFDPDNLLNPHKIVDPWPMTKHLRYGPSFSQRALSTFFDYGKHGGAAGLAQMCTGVGQCRQRLTGVMCPSYVATGDEKHTTRARANALRSTLSNRSLLSGFDDPALSDVMDLCVSCKACRTECPTGVDISRLKAEHRAHLVLRDGASRRARLVADMPRTLSRASWFPRLANALAQSGAVRSWMERRFSLDRRVPPPQLATRTFRSWWRAHVRRRPPHSISSRGRVVYFVDTWTNYIAPEVGAAAVRLIEAAGFDVDCPPLVCCGRPHISQGLLAEARTLASINIERLLLACDGAAVIVGSEPSCVLTLLDEYPALLPGRASRTLVSRVRLVDQWLAETLDRDPGLISWKSDSREVWLHAHCHQKALVGTHPTRSLLARAFGDGAREIDSGCCGMAGSFGHEVEHYEVARAMGEHRLFPAVRARGSAGIAVSGFSCRHQIEHHTGAHPRHVLEWLAEQME